MEREKLIAGKFYLDTEDGFVFQATEEELEGDRWVKVCDGTEGWVLDDASYYECISE